MKNYWDLNIIEKEKIIESAINNKNYMNSLSNDVYSTDKLIIKRKENINDPKSSREINFLQLINRKHEVINNYLVIEKIKGRNITEIELNNQNIIDNLIRFIESFKRIRHNEIESYKYSHKISKEINQIKSLYKNLNINENLLTETIELINSLDENTLSHSDLNRNNILINEITLEIKLIDYEEVSISNEFQDFATLIANWDINLENIKYISKKMNLNLRHLILMSILFSARYSIWNSKMFTNTNDPKYEDMLNYFNKHCKNLEKLL